MVEFLLLLLIALLLAANLVVTFLSNERIREVILQAAREARERGLRALELKMEEMAASMDLSREDVPGHLRQMILDVTGRRVILSPSGLGVDEKDVPCVVATGGDGLTRYFFVPEPSLSRLLPLRRREQVQVFRIDAYTSDPLSPFLLRRIYALLGGGEVPRCSSWRLVVSRPRGLT